MRQRWNATGIIVCWLLLLLTGMGRALPTQGITFTLAPPAGTHYREQKTTTLTTGIGDQPFSATLRETATVRVERAGADFRFLVTRGEVAQRTTGEGMAGATSTLAGLMNGLEMASTVDARGNLLAIDGGEALRGRIREQAPPAMRNVLLLSARDDHLLAQAKSDWERRAQRFIGRTVNVGSLWIDTQDAELGIGKVMPLYRATKVMGWEQRQGHDVLRIRTWCHNTAEGLAKSIDLPHEAVAAAVGNPIETPAGVNIVITGDQLIDPSTLLCYGESFTTNAGVKLSIPGQQRTLKLGIVENTAITYD